MFRRFCLFNLFLNKIKLYLWLVDRGLCCESTGAKRHWTAIFTNAYGGSFASDDS